MKSSLVPW